MSTDPSHRRTTFLETYGDESIRHLIADWHEADLDPKAGSWTDFPPPDFLEFCRTYPRTSFDGIPPAAHHKRSPSFLISQAHRLWMTTSLIHQQLKAVNARSMLDLGSFPFFAPLILRDYFGFDGDITATTNRPLDPESAAFLERKRIAVELLDLDPYVRDPDSAETLPRRLPAHDGSFDLISCSHVVEHLYHPVGLVAESARLLRAGGELVITTDNAMMLSTFLNYISGAGYTFEPVEQTAAMHFDFWRGHVRFFTEHDLKTLLGRCGLALQRTEYFECFYDVLFDDYFANPTPKMQRFRAKMLAETPWLRNDIAVVGRKDGGAPHG